MMQRYNLSKKRGFALIEVLIATTILSMVLLGVYSGISSSIEVISNSRNYTKAIILSKSIMNTFRKDKMRGTDIKGASISGNESFKYDRITERYENPMLGPLGVKKTDVTVKWKYKGHDYKYKISMLFQVD